MRLRASPDEVADSVIEAIEAIDCASCQVYNVSAIAF